MPLILPILVFVFVVLIAVAAYLVLGRSAPNVAERLQELNTEKTSGSLRSGDTSQTVEMAKKLATDLNRFAPQSATEVKRLQGLLVQAGYRSPNAPLLFRGLQLLSLLAFPLLVVLILLLTGTPLASGIIYLGVGALIGFMLPKFILNYQVKGRQDRLRCGLADALDLLVVSVEAGLGLNAGLVRVSEEMKKVHPDISDEFALVNTEIRVGRSREDALRNLADRSGVEDLRSLCAMLIQTDRFGTSISRALRVYTDALRTKRRQRAEQAAQRAAVKMLFPLAVFLFPTLFIMMLGPAALTMMESFSK